jgi:hypothetical protein
MVIAGQACVTRKGKGKGGPKEPCVTLNPGDMLIIQPGTRGNGSVQKFDVPKTVGTALLLTDFDKLPKWALDDIQEGIDQAGGGNPPGGGGKDPTGHDSVDQKSASSGTPPPKFVPPPGSPPPDSRTRPR